MIWTVFTLLYVFAVMLCLDAAERGDRTRRRACLTVIVLGAIPFCLRIAGAISENIESPPEWDFMGFWLHARSAVAGLDFYDPHHAQRLAAGLKLTQEFRHEIVDVGFWYPPPSMLLFAPLGWFSAQQAVAGWMAFHVLAGALAAVLLQRTFFPHGGKASLAGCAALLLACNGTLWTFRFAQTTLVALVALLVFWRRRQSAAGGAWLALGVITKPFLGLLALVPLVRMRGKVILGLALTLALMMALSVWAFGFETCRHFFAANQVTNKPDWIYNEIQNQSLLGFILRFTHAQCGAATCLRHPLYLACVAVLGTITLGVMYRLRLRQPDWALPLVLAAALLLYPLSGASYCVLMVPALLAFWGIRKQLVGGALTAAAVIATTYTLAEWHEGNRTVLAFLLLWATLAMVGARLAGKPGWPLRSSAAN